MVYRPFDQPSGTFIRRNLLRHDQKFNGVVQYLVGLHHRILIRRQVSSASMCMEEPVMKNISRPVPSGRESLDRPEHARNGATRRVHSIWSDLAAVSCAKRQAFLGIRHVYEAAFITPLNEQRTFH